jgi:formate--tetrahydrofolate ligase
LKLHGGVTLADLGREDLAAVRRGTENLSKHVENVRSFGLPPVVALNRFTGDTDSEVAAVLDVCRGWGVPAAVSRGWELGGAGTTELAETVTKAMSAATRGAFHQLYPDDWPLTRKIETIVTQMYGADGVTIMPAAAAKLARWESLGYGNLPVCMAKTQNSLSDDPKRLGRPRGFRITVRDAKLAAGAGFVVAYAGDILTMPGLPKVPGAESMDVDADGNVVGLF